MKDKQALRQEFKKKRIEFYRMQQNLYLQHSHDICEKAEGLIPNEEGVIVAGYYPLPGEIKTQFLLDRLSKKNIPLALPCITETDALVFHCWEPGAELIQRAFGVWEPFASVPSLDPTHVFLPLLAYGEKGVRLGYGKGHYDKALAAVESKKKILKIGLAFSWLYSPDLRPESHDVLLDAVVTEKEIKWFLEK